MVDDNELLVIDGLTVQGHHWKQISDVTIGMPILSNFEKAACKYVKT